MQSDTYRETLAKLDRGIQELTDSTRWQEFLDAQATFRQYSYRNVLLIAQQCPHAAYITGFHAWRKLGRTVRKGERAIWILAPSFSTRRRGDADDENDIRVTRFVPVPVFDISQTDGRDLPEVCRRLDADGPSGAFVMLTEVANEIGFQVDVVDLDAGVNGECRFAERTIRIEQRNSGAQRVKSLAHELAHAILHEDVDNRARAELEAESCAYIVCQHFGLDSGRYSFGYVASWMGGGSLAREALESSCREIARATQEIVSRCESRDGSAGDRAESTMSHPRSPIAIGGR